MKHRVRMSACEPARRRSDERDTLDESNVRAVRAGHGANCSSIGSVIDTLFATAAVGSAILAAVLAAMKNERVTVVGEDDEEEREAKK